MRRFLGGLLIVCGLTAWIGTAGAWWQSVQQVSVGATTYVGPGDVVSGATAYFGSKAYTLAYAMASGKAYNVCIASDIACGDLVFGSDGNVVISTIGGSSCAIVTCTVKTAYNQSGTTSCTGSVTCDVTNATEANRPTFVANSLNSQYCMVFSSGQGLNSAATILVALQSQPYSLTGVAKRTGNTTGYNNIIGAAGTAGIFFAPSVNNAEVYAGTDLVVAATDNSFHAIQGGFNGGSSTASADGTTTSGAAGASSFSGTMNIGEDGGDHMVGVICQAGWWAGIAFSGPNISALNSRDHSNWGF